MSSQLQPEQLAYIKEHLTLGQKSPAIALALQVSVWTVRKYARRLKKIHLYTFHRVGLFRVRFKVTLSRYDSRFMICVPNMQVGEHGVS